MQENSSENLFLNHNGDESCFEVEQMEEQPLSYYRLLDQLGMFSICLLIEFLADACKEQHSKLEMVFPFETWQGCLMKLSEAVKINRYGGFQAMPVLALIYNRW